MGAGMKRLGIVIGKEVLLKEDELRTEFNQ